MQSVSRTRKVVVDDEAEIVDVRIASATLLNIGITQAKRQSAQCAGFDVPLHIEIGLVFVVVRRLYASAVHIEQVGTETTRSKLREVVQPLDHRCLLVS